MHAQAAVQHIPRRWLLWLLLAFAGFLVLLISYGLGTTTHTAKQTNMIPGAGPVDASGHVMRAAAGGGMGGARGGGMAGGGGASTSGVIAASPQPAFEAAKEAESPAPGASTANLPWPTGPMLIRTADLRVRVEDVAKAHEEVARIARAAHGYIAETTFNSENGPASASVTLRVPGLGLDSAVDRIAALGKLLSKQIGAQEVTEEYVDLTSRKRNLEREEQRLLELLQRAGKMRDLLEVESTLARVRGDIERISGRMRYLENRVSLSTIRVQLDGPQPRVNVGGPVWSASDVSRSAVRSLIDTGRGLATIGIWLGVYSPVWVPIALFLVWLVRRTSPRPAAASAATPSPGS